MLEEFERYEREQYGFTTREVLGVIRDFYVQEVPEIAKSEYEAARELGGLLKEDISALLEK